MPDSLPSSTSPSSQQLCRSAAKDKLACNHVYRLSTSHVIPAAASEQGHRLCGGSCSHASPLALPRHPERREAQVRTLVFTPSTFHPSSRRRRDKFAWAISCQLTSYCHPSSCAGATAVEWRKLLTAIYPRQSSSQQRTGGACVQLLPLRSHRRSCWKPTTQMPGKVNPDYSGRNARICTGNDSRFVSLR